MLSLMLLAVNVPNNEEGITYLTLAVLVALVTFLGIVLFVAKRYKRCPSNRVLVIFGKVGSGQSALCIHGGGRFVLPIIQDYAYLSLEPIQIEVPLRDALSIENIRVNVPSVFTVAIGIEPAIMQNAAIRLLGLDTPHIKKQAEDIIFGQLRQVIASMHIEDINRDREKFLHNIQNSVEPELQKIGLVLINVNITDITDGSGYIEAIGRKAASEAIQIARGDVADQEKLGEVRVAEADRDKTVQVAEARKVREIGTRGAAREQAVRIADLNKEQQVGEKRAGFAQDMEVAEADREKRIAVANANALAFAGETESQAKVADAEARLQVKKAEAYQMGETRRREAEAAVLGGPEPRDGQSGPGRGGESRGRTPSRRRSSGQGRESESHRPSRSRVGKAPSRGRRRSGGHLRPPRSRSPGPVRNPRQERGGLPGDDRSLRRSQPGVSDADGRAPRQAGRNVRQGDRQHQVRQSGRLGKRRSQRPDFHRELPPRDEPHAAADAAGAARRGRDRDPRITGQAQPGTGATAPRLPRAFLVSIESDRHGRTASPIGDASIQLASGRGSCFAWLLASKCRWHLGEGKPLGDNSRRHVGTTRNLQRSAIEGRVADR